jgi:hypothetical protein
LGRRINLFQRIVGKLQPILSRLPQEFEKVALARPEQREQATQRLLGETGDMMDKADEGGRDADLVSVGRGRCDRSPATGASTAAWPSTADRILWRAAQRLLSCTSPTGSTCRSSQVLVLT